jgi:hypothetical protein
MLLTKELILNAIDLPRERVEVPEWGGHVFVRRMRADEALAYEGKDRDVLFLVATCVCDDQAQPVFSSEDVEALRGKSWSVVQRLVAAAVRMNTIDDAKKN